MPEIRSKLVQEVLKENYDFGFATVDHKLYEEKELEDALTSWAMALPSWEDKGKLLLVDAQGR